MNTPKYIESYLSQPPGERAAVDVEFGVEPFPAGPIDSTIDALYGVLIHDDKTTLSVSQSPEAALGEYVLSQQSASGSNKTAVLMRTLGGSGFRTTTLAVKVIGSGTLAVTLWNTATSDSSKTYDATSADGVFEIAYTIGEIAKRPNAVSFEGANALISNIRWE